MVKPLMFYGTLAWHPSTRKNVAKFERVKKRALRFVYRRHIPEAPKTELLSVPQQLAYNDLTFFRKFLDWDAEMDAMAQITKDRVMRNSDGEHRLIPQKSRTDLDIQSFSFRPLPSALKSCPPSQFPKLCKLYLSE